MSIIEKASSTRDLINLHVIVKDWGRSTVWNLLYDHIHII